MKEREAKILACKKNRSEDEGEKEVKEKKRWRDSAIVWRTRATERWLPVSTLLRQGSLLLSLTLFLCLALARASGAKILALPTFRYLSFLARIIPPASLARASYSSSHSWVSLCIFAWSPYDRRVRVGILFLAIIAPLFSLSFCLRAPRARGRPRARHEGRKKKRYKSLARKSCSQWVNYIYRSLLSLSFYYPLFF